MANIRRRKTKAGVTYYLVCYRDPSDKGKELSEWCRTLQEAKARKAAVETEVRRGEWIDPRQAERLFSVVADEWLHSNVGKRSSTFARDETIVRVHLVPKLGQREIGSIRTRDVRALVADWAERLKPRTVKRNYGVARAIFAFAAESDYIGRSPCRSIKLPTAEPVEARVLDAEELADLAASLGPDWDAMAYLGAVLGLRWAECAGLRVRRLDLLERRLTVAEQVVRGYKGRVELGPPKSEAGRRTLTLPEPLVDLLAAHLARKRLTAADGDALVFPNIDGGPLHYANWRRNVWIPATVEADLEGLGFHDLRRTNATALVVEGVDLKTAQVRLGHSDPRLTLGVYAQAVTEAEQDASERLGKVFLKPPRTCRGLGATS